MGSEWKYLGCASSTLNPCALECSLRLAGRLSPSGGRDTPCSFMLLPSNLDTPVESVLWQNPTGKDHCPVLAVFIMTWVACPSLTISVSPRAECVCLWSQGQLGSDCVDWEQEGSSSLKENGSGWRASKSRRCNRENIGTRVSGGDEEREMDQTAGRELEAL